MNTPDLNTSKIVNNNINNNNNSKLYRQKSDLNLSNVSGIMDENSYNPTVSGNTNVKNKFQQLRSIVGVRRVESVTNKDS